MKKNAVAIIFENELIGKDIFSNKPENTYENLYKNLESFQPNDIDGYLIDTSDIFLKKVKNQILFKQKKIITNIILDQKIYLNYTEFQKKLDVLLFIRFQIILSMLINNYY